MLFEIDHDAFMQLKGDVYIMYCPPHLKVSSLRRVLSLKSY